MLYLQKYVTYFLEIKCCVWNLSLIEIQYVTACKCMSPEPFLQVGALFLASMTACKSESTSMSSQEASWQKWP